MSETRAPADDQIANDYLAGRGAAGQARLDDWWRGTLANTNPTPPTTPAPAPGEDLPIGKRILSGVGNFAYGLVKPFFEGPSFVERSAQEQALAAEKEKELGRPLTLQERLNIVPLMESAGAQTGLGFAGGGIDKAAGAEKNAQAVGELGATREPVPMTPGEPPDLAARLQEHLGNIAPTEGVPRETPSIAPKAEPSATAPRDILQLGDPLEPAVTLRTTPRLAAQADVTLGRMAAEGEATRVSGAPEAEPTVMSADTIHDYLSGARVDNPVKVNLARIGSNEDIADALAQVSKTIPAQAVQSHEATIYAADALGMRPQDLLSNYKGQQLNAAETTAMRFIVDSSAEQLIKFASAAREPLASAESKGQFLKAFTVHRSLQQYFENARAESGRTQNAWKIISQTRSDATQAIGDLIKNVDRTGDLTNLAENIADMDNPLHVSRLVAASTQGTGRDTLMKIMYNIRLSSPTTIAKKAATDVTMPFWNAATRYTAEKLGSGAVIPGEAGSLIGGYIGSFTDALRAGGKALKAGESQFWKDYHTMDTLDLSEGYGGTPQAQAARINQRFRLSSLANGVSETAELDQPTRGMLGYLQSAMPTSWIAGVDDFAKVWEYRANLRALAWRQAEGDATEFERLLDNVPSNLHQQAMSQSLKYTFQEPLTGAFADMRNFLDKLNFHVSVPGKSGFDFPVGRLIVPFVKVPANIERMAYRASPLPLVPLFRSPQIRAALANPGADRDILMAEMGLGTAMSVGYLAYALSGYITGKGPTDPSLNREWRAAGNQPYSAQIPGARPFTYNWFEPHGTVIAGIADTVNLLKFAKDEDNETLALSLGFGVGQALLSKTYFQGAADFLDGIMHPDQDAGRFTSRLLASFVPQGLQHVGEALDDWRRAHYGIMDAIEANTPLVRQGLPAAQTFWGDPISAREAYLPFLSGKTAGIVSPATLGPEPESVEPIDKWIFDNRASFPHEEETGRGMPAASRSLIYKGGAGVDAMVKLEPNEYARYKELSGNVLKDEDGLGAKDSLNALVLGAHPSASAQARWDEASPATKALMVRSIVTKFRAGAQKQMREDFPEINASVEEMLGERASQLQGPR